MLTTMIPPGATIGYDDPSCRTPAQLAQDAPIWPDGSRALLWRCPTCRQAWYEQGRFHAFMLSPALQACLSEQVHAAHPLPSALCPLCMQLTFGGWPRIEAYRYRARGYRLFWEQASAPQHRFLACICAAEQDESEQFVQRALTGWTDLVACPEVGAVCLRWLCALPAPALDEEVGPLATPAREALQRLFPAPAAQDWCGYAWRSWCPPLGCEALILLAVTTPEQPCSLRFLLACWRQVAWTMAMFTADSTDSTNSQTTQHRLQTNKGDMA